MNDQISEKLESRSLEFAQWLYPDAIVDGKVMTLDHETKIFIAGIRRGQIYRNEMQISPIELASIEKSKRFLGIEEPIKKVPVTPNVTAHHQDEPPLRELDEISRPVRIEPQRYKSEQQRALPHNAEAERGILGSILISPEEVIPVCRRQITDNHFHVPAHSIIYSTLIDYWRECEALDVITLTQVLIGKGMLDQVGGPLFVSQLFTEVPSAANVQNYIEIVQSNYGRRQIIAASTKALKLAYDPLEDVDSIIQESKISIEKIGASASNDVEDFNFKDLMNFDPKEDPDNLIGNRWVCRGHTCLWAGGAGFGKSTWEIQLAIYWACGLSPFGFRPVKPLKSLILQAENDAGDTAEQLQGVFEGIMESTDFMGMKPEEVAARIEKNIVIKRIISDTGERFCGILDSLTKEHKPDLVWIDPLFSFAGFDMCEQSSVSHFMREMLMSVAVKNRVAIMVIHHTGKPDKDSAAKSSWSDLDFQYLGFGSSELQNAFRSVNIILPVSGAKNTFRLVLSKRGARAGALSLDEDCPVCSGAKKHENGFPCTVCRGTGRAKATSLYIAWAQKGMTWMQVQKPEQAEQTPGKKNQFKQTCTVEQIFEVMSATHAQSSTMLGKWIVNEKLMSNGTFWQLWKELVASGRIEQKDGGWVRKQ